MQNYTKAVSESSIQQTNQFLLHRNSHYGNKAWEFLGFHANGFTDENGCFLSVGCASGRLDMTDYMTVKHAKNPFQKFEEIFAEKVTDAKPRNRYFLYRFLFCFQKNDYIIVPNSEYGVFHVFQIEDDTVLYCDDLINELEAIDLNNEEIKKSHADFTFFRKLKPIRVNISSREYAKQHLSSVLKYRGTNCFLSEQAQVNLIEALTSPAPISLYADMTEKILFGVKETMQSLTPDKFEKLICWYFNKIGADTSKVLGKNASGKQGKEDADIQASFEALKFKVYVQAKAYQNEADLNWACEQIKKYRELRIQNDEYTCAFWVVTMADNAVYDKVYSLEEKIRIIDGNEFAQMLLDVGLKDIDSAF